MINAVRGRTQQFFNFSFPAVERHNISEPSAPTPTPSPSVSHARVSSPASPSQCGPSDHGSGRKPCRAINSYRGRRAECSSTVPKMLAAEGGFAGLIPRGKGAARKFTELAGSVCWRGGEAEGGMPGSLGQQRGGFPPLSVPPISAQFCRHPPLP